ncbi:MAG TPA: TonB-dependent receptor plug domain-containing protein, partial [Daejeonella sp.]|nr:TonB-dependent receptor plug domain-containing protein [Daejeonella sp.]
MKKIVLSILGLVLFLNTGFAQNRTVNGKVTALSDELPLPGVSVTVKGSSIGTQTDAEGLFQLTVPSTSSTLVFKYIGYKSLEVPIASGTMNVVMEEDQKQLSEVVVVGYGTQVRRELTGSIAKVTSKEFEDTSLTSFQSAMQGRAAGVFVNSSSGKLGQALQIRVRGVSSVSAGSSPLYVIDGVPVVSQKLGSFTEADDPLAAISPEDIESIEVLKDAAAASIYGSRASNGVVLVTTKKGRSGNTKVDFGVQAGTSKPTKKADFLNATEYKELMNEAFAYEGYLGLADAAAVWTDWTGTDDWNSTNNTDWVDQGFQDGYVQQYNLNINGGDSKTRFLLGGTFN